MGTAGGPGRWCRPGVRPKRAEPAGPDAAAGAAGDQAQGRPAESALPAPLGPSGPARQTEVS